MANFRKYPDRVIVDKDGTDVASTAANALQSVLVSPDGGIVTDDTANAIKILPVDAAGSTTIQQREPFIFRPAATALASGVVASGTRSGGSSLTGAGTANQTEWSSYVTYEPLRSGKIDGIAASGVISGQMTFGVKTAAGTAEVKLTADIRNKAGTAVTFLALTGAFSATTAEIFKTYDIPHLLTVANMNAVPFEIRHGNQSGEAATAAVTRIMESSYIQGEFEAGS